MKKAALTALLALVTISLTAAPGGEEGPLKVLF